MSWISISLKRNSLALWCKRDTNFSTDSKSKMKKAKVFTVNGLSQGFYLKFLFFLLNFSATNWVLMNEIKCLKFMYVIVFVLFSFRWKQQYRRKYPDEFLDMSKSRQVWNLIQLYYMLK